MPDYEENLPAVQEDQNENVQIIGSMIREIMSPVLQTMATFMQQSTEALERVAAAQKIQSDRLEAMEKQLRLNTLVTPTQVRYLNDAIKKHARELLAKKDMDDDGKAVTKLAGFIRKAVTARYGVAALYEIPKHEYNVAMGQIESWNDLLLIRDITREVKIRREKEAVAAAE